MDILSVCQPRDGCVELFQGHGYVSLYKSNTEWFYEADTSMTKQTSFIHNLAKINNIHI